MKTNYTKTHAFEIDGTVEVGWNKSPYCICGLPEDNPIHELFGKSEQLKKGDLQGEFTQKMEWLREFLDGPHSTYEGDGLEFTESLTETVNVLIEKSGQEGYKQGYVKGKLAGRTCAGCEELLPSSCEKCQKLWES
jgi:hypothetical protein